MSQKITAKNLQYNRDLPPFLARLHGQHNDNNGGPDPILAARRRPAKPRSASAEAEDAPLVVDEHGNAVDVAVGADGSVRERAGGEGAAAEGAADGAGKVGEAGGGDGVPGPDASAAPGERVAGIGGPRKKRKMGKIVGAGDDEEDGDAGEGGGAGRERGRGRGVTQSRGARETDEAAAAAAAAAAAKSKPRKKAKKIKLSFGDDEG